MGTVISWKTIPMPHSGIKIVALNISSVWKCSILSIHNPKSCFQLYLYWRQGEGVFQSPVLFLYFFQWLLQLPSCIFLKDNGKYREIFLRAVWQFKTSHLLARWLLVFYSLRHTKCEPIISFHNCSHVTHTWRSSLKRIHWAFSSKTHKIQDSDLASSPFPQWLSK